METGAEKEVPCWSVATLEAHRDPEAAEAVVALFERVAAEEGWEPGGELRLHIERSAFFSLHDDNQLKRPISGGLQLVLQDGDGRLPCCRVWPEIQISKETKSAHIAVMAVAQESRGSGSGVIPAFWLLTVEMWRYCVLAGIGEVWIEATPRVLALYRRLGFSLTIRGELRVHWGEECYPASMTAREVAGALAVKAVKSRTYRAILANAFRFEK